MGHDKTEKQRVAREEILKELSDAAEKVAQAEEDEDACDRAHSRSRTVLLNAQNDYRKAKAKAEDILPTVPKEDRGFPVGG